MRPRFFVLSRKGEAIFFTIPKGWTPVYFTKEEVCALPNVEELVEKAIERPLGTLPLQKIAVGCKNILIVIDDDTRPTPVKEAMKVVLETLRGTGAEITVLVALGTHAPMSLERLERRLGRHVLSRLRVVQHDAWAEDLLPVRLLDGSTVRVNPLLSEADLRIGICSVLPHPMAGFGGGPKLLMPGVCDFESIKKHHMRLTIHPRSSYGLCEGNPFHEAIASIAWQVGFDFSINFVYNSLGKPVEVLAGKPAPVFRKSVQKSMQLLGLPFKRRVDVTIASSFPHIHGAQFAKGLHAPLTITRKEGAMIVFLPLETPPPQELFQAIVQLRQGLGKDIKPFIKETMARGEAFLPERPLEFNMAIASLLLRPSIRTVIVSETISKAQAESMHFEHACSLEEAIGRLEEAFPSARVAIMAAGAFLVPIQA